MKLRLLILLAAALAAAPAAGQTIKSLGYNTTNGFVTYSGSNSLTFTNALQFSTNARAATRTNLGLPFAALTNTNTTGFNTALGLANLPDDNGFAVSSAQVLWDNAAGGQVGVYVDDGDPVFGPSGASPWRSALGLGLPALTNTNNANFCTAIGLGATNNVTFSNITASGTLAVTGNVTLSGVNNTMPGATNAASGSSLMTRDLSDDRYTTYVWLTGSSDNQTITNGGFKFLGPSRINSFSLGYGASIPAGYTKFRVLLNFGWLTDPATNSSNFQVFVRFNNVASLSSNPFEAESGTVAGTTGLYPTNSPTNGLVGTLTRIGVLNTTNSVYSFRSEYETIPAAWQSNALSNGFYHLIGVALRNNSGGSLTDGYNAGHPPVGIIEFRK